MISELFNKMKSTEIVLTVKRSTMDQTIESEHDFFLSDTNESMFFHTLVSDDAPAILTTTRTVATSNIPSSSSALYNPMNRLERVPADSWHLDKSELRLNPHNINDGKNHIEITNRSRIQQLFEVHSSLPHIIGIEPDCGVLAPGATAKLMVSLRSTKIPANDMYIRIRVDKKHDAQVPVIIDK